MKGVFPGTITHALGITLVVNNVPSILKMDGVYVTDQYHPGVSVLPDVKINVKIDSMFSSLGWICVRVQPHRRNRSTYDAQGIL